MFEKRRFIMTNIPPNQVPLAIVSKYPELLVLDSSAKTIVSNLVKNAPGFNNFLKSIQDQGPPADNSGWARLQEIILSNGEPAKNKAGEIIYRLRLSDKTVTDLAPFLANVLSSAMNNTGLKDLCWTVQKGVVPGQETGTPASQHWTLNTLSPKAGVEFPSVDFTADGNAFQLKFKNGIPRHLALYIQFLSGGKPIQPTNWTSRLPAGVPSDFETDTLKYLGSLAPNTPVACLPVPVDPQAINFNLPTGSDAASIFPGSIGNSNWLSVNDAIGVILTFILDYAVPVTIMVAGGAVEKASWFQGLIANPDIQRSIIKAGEFILTDPSITDVSSLLACLANKIDQSMLDNGLKDLRANINKNVGDEAVENAAPYLCWLAQTLKTMLDNQDRIPADQTQGTSRLLSIPATFPLPLSPHMMADLQVDIAPAPLRGEWPDNAAQYRVSIQYAGGFTQVKTGSVPQDPPASPVSVTFGSVRTGGIISIQAAYYTQDGKVCASGTASLDTSSPRTALLSKTLTLTDEPVIISASTTYTHKRKLTYDTASSTYSWVLSGPPTAVKTNIGPCAPDQTLLCGLVGITLQESARCIGYTWRMSGSGMKDCGGTGSPISTAYLFQNIGVINPNTALKSLNCGFVQQPFLVYQNPVPGADVYLDSRDPAYYLRDVVLDAQTPFNLSQGKSRGRFRQSSLSAFVIHPAGYAAAVSTANNRMEILKLSTTAVNDAEAPISILVSGPGTREGLLKTPVGISVTPGGVLLVLENGNARVQAFDVYGNPVPCFNGSASMTLKPETGVEYQDIAVSPAGPIYILSNINGGTQASQYRLDIYNPDGSFLARTEGVNAARITVDSWGRVYTLNYETIPGPNDHVGPSISEWCI